MITNKYRGVYTLFYETDIKGNQTNENISYLRGKYNTEIFRYDKNTIAIYFISGATTNNVLPQFDKLGVKYKCYVQGDFESVYHFKEKDLEKIHSVLHFQIKGKNQQKIEMKNKRK
jgi:hypothetical protein